MTTYENNIAAVEQIPMPELYELRRGWDRFFYTSYPTDLTFKGHVYVAAPIQRGDFTVDTNLNTVSLRVTAAVLSSFANFIAYQPTQRTQIYLYRAISDDLTEYAVVFDGWLTTITFNEKNMATAQFDQRASILDRDVDMVIHQAPCNHHVFDNGCRLDGLLWKVVVPVIVNQEQLTHDDFATYADGYFTGGEVHYQDDARLITNHVGNTLTLHVPFSGDVSTGTTVEVYPGCDGRPSTCRDKYNNIENFLGFPYIPDKNPAIWGV